MLSTHIIFVVTNINNLLSTNRPGSMLNILCILANLVLPMWKAIIFFEN